MIRLIASEIDKLQINPDYEDILTCLMNWEKSSPSNSVNIFFQFILKTYASFLKKGQRQKLADTICDFQLGSEAFFILTHLAKKLQTFEEWIDELNKIQQLIFEIQENCKVNVGGLTLKNTHKWIIEQLYQHIFEGMNPQLALEGEFLNKILHILKRSKLMKTMGFYLQPYKYLQALIK